jgi:hypothetical protein
VALVALGLAGLAAIPVLKWADVHWADEAIKDLWGRWRHDEDWARAVSLPTGLDYGWLSGSKGPVLVAHALGESGGMGQNTLSALQRSTATGLRLLEIDIWLDTSGRLRCHHGPKPPSPWAEGECTFDAALDAARRANGWLVLDIKTAFAATGAEIVARLADDDAASHIVFQLYRPDDLSQFASWSARRRLPGPIVTAYLARRSLDHVAFHAARVGAKALTVPLYRLPALGKRPPGLVVLTHPVHECAAIAAARAGHADGLYLTSALAGAPPGSCAR